MQGAPTPTPNPLASGNRLQQAYYRWALPYYERMAPELREQVEQLDVQLYTSRGLGLWLGWLLGLAGLVAGLRAAGLPWGAALGISTVLWVAMSFAVLSAWLKPEAFLRKKAAHLLLRLTLFCALGGLFGFSFGHWMRRGSLDLALLAQRLVDSLSVLVPALLATGFGMALLFWAVASASRQATQRRLETAQLTAERDAAARHALQADLRLLQAQIQPHFVFNTLATLQHWVDKKDERAGPLLRELTGFLRRSTEMLGRESVPLHEELQAVRHYLAILQVRMGKRLSWDVQLPVELAAQPVPPGLALTLVENAIEHGLEPKIGGGGLRVEARQLPEGWQLSVDDDGAGLAPGSEDGIGLANVRRRLALHFGAQASLRLQPRAEGGTRALVDIPSETP